MSDELVIEYNGNAIVIRFTRPEIRNPLSITVLEQLHRIVDDLSIDHAISTVIFTGTGESFASVLT